MTNRIPWRWYLHRRNLEIIFVNVLVLVFAIGSSHAGQHLIAAFVIESMVIGFFVSLTLLYKGIVSRSMVAAFVNTIFFSLFYLGITTTFLAFIGMSTGEIAFRDVNFEATSWLTLYAGIQEMIWQFFSVIAHYIFEYFRWVVCMFVLVYGYEFMRNLIRLGARIKSTSYAMIAVPIVKRVVILIAWSYILWWFILTPVMLEETLAESVNLNTLNYFSEIISTSLLLIITYIKLWFELLRNKQPRTAIAETTDTITPTERDEKTIPIQF